MTISRVQSATNTSTGASVTVTLGSTPVSGNLLLIACAFTGTTGSATLSGGTWNPIVQVGGLYMFWRVAGASEPTSITLSSSVTGLSAAVMEYSGGIYQTGGIPGPFSWNTTNFSGATSSILSTDPGVAGVNMLVVDVVGLDAANSSTPSYTGSAGCTAVATPNNSGSSLFVGDNVACTGTAPGSTVSWTGAATGEHVVLAIYSTYDVGLCAQGAIATGTTSAAPAFRASTMAGNLLVCRVMGITGTVSTPAGWTLANSAQGAYLFYKANCAAGETAPSISNSGGTFTAADLLEFSGIQTTSPLDKTGTNGAVWNNGTNTGIDTLTNDLAVWVGAWINSKSATYTAVTDSWSATGGLACGAANTGATKSADLFHGACYLLAGNGGVTADKNTASATPSSGVMSSGGCVIASFKAVQPPAAQPAAPDIQVANFGALTSASQW